MTMRRAVVAGVVAWLVFLVATIPADRALALAPQMPGVAIGSVQGTLWRGQANSLVAKGVQIDDVHWRFRPLSMFLGQLEFDLEGMLAGKPLHAIAGKALSGEPYFEDVQVSISASEVLYRLGVNQVSVGGQLVLDLDDVHFSPAGIPMFSGEMRWAPADIDAPLILSLGTATLTTQHDDDLTRGDLVADGGALQVQADVTLEAGGAYKLDATIREKGTMPQAVRKFLSTFAEEENGSYRLEWSDTLL